MGRIGALRAPLALAAVAALAGLATVATGAARAEPTGDPLADARSKAELTARLGVAPERCVALAGGLELCQWHLGNRDPAWRPLARAIDTSYRVNAICAVPGDGSARPAGSCRVLPCASDREGWVVPVATAQKGSPSLAQVREEREQLAARATAELDQASTLVELSWRIGAVPDECRMLDAGSRVCVWHATSRTRGHALLAATISAPRRKKVRLSCRLPAADAPRAPGSCEVAIDE